MSCFKFKKRIPFLSAVWSQLLVVNFEVNPLLLKSYCPFGTELDSYSGKHYVSLVAFLFKKNKLWGLIPTFPHYSFEEANLRYYVKRQEPAETKKGVAFVREVVPSHIIAWTARTFYDEPYEKHRMSHKISDNLVSYSWGKSLENLLQAKISPTPQTLTEGSFPYFILEHYWGYTPQKDGSTLEYEVEHPPWLYHEVSDLKISDSLRLFYGGEFSECLSKEPHSAFLAVGSPVRVHFPNRIK